MDQQHLFLSNNIFDIDSALDRLEENLFTNSDDKSAAAISIEKFEQQKIDNGQQQQMNREVNEENGNKVDDTASKFEEELSANKGADDEVVIEKVSDKQQITDVVTYSTMDEISIQKDDEESATLNLIPSQTITLTTLSIDDKTTTTLASSDSSSSSSSDSEGEELIPAEITENQDESMIPLISEESINQCEQDVDEQEELVDDLPVTTDLTLTKTVELTENEPDVDEVVQKVVEKLEEDQSEQKTFNIQQEMEENRPIEIVKPIMMMEEPREIEVSQYNFESTMDDISDAELESLEQELEEIVAAAEQNFSNENSLKELEKIVEENAKNEEVKEDIQEKIESEAEKEKLAEETPKVDETEQVIEKMETTESEKTQELTATQNEEVVEKVENELKTEEVKEDDDPPSIQESTISEAHEAVEPMTDPALSSSTDESASIRNIPSQSNEDFSMNESNSTGSLTSAPDLGRVPPYWIPDHMTPLCMHCDSKFSTFKRRHHCRACGLLLCSNCCSEKYFLHYLQGEGRICKPCLEQLIKLQQQQQNQPNRPRRPNPANPMEYCSTVPPSQQVDPSRNEPLSVMVPVPTSALKRGPRTSERKSVIFSDGIRPGSDFEPTPNSPRTSPDKSLKVNMPKIIDKTQSFIPEKESELPPLIMKENDFRTTDNNLQLLQRLRQEELKFAINKNFIVNVKIVTRELIEFQLIF